MLPKVQYLNTCHFVIIADNNLECSKHANWSFFSHRDKWEGLNQILSFLSPCLFNFFWSLGTSLSSSLLLELKLVSATTAFSGFAELGCKSKHQCRGLLSPCFLIKVRGSEHILWKCMIYRTLVGSIDGGHGCRNPPYLIMYEAKNKLFGRK